MRDNCVLPVGLGCALIIAILAIGLKISATPAWSAADPAQQTVNRMLKGDRLPPISVRMGSLEINGHVEPVAVPRLMEGCEAVVSSIGEPPLAQVAGSCQT